jgi:DNA-directed RNA polymerase specialized sigma24 family protein
MLALLQLGRHDDDARRVLLQALWPGLLHLTTVYGRSWDYEDTAATVVVLALERIASYPLHRRTRTAANIIRDVQHGLHRMRIREQEAALALGEPVPIHETAQLPEVAARTAAQEVIDLLGEAVRTAELSESEARLIVLRRVFDTPTAATAAALGRPPSTIRKTRERAEARLARMATAQVACA